MLRWVALGGTLGVCLILETTLFSWLSIEGIQPDFVLILVVFFALFNGSAGGAFFGFLGGLAQDALTGQYLGLNALSKMAVGFIVAQLERKVYKDYPFIPMLVVFMMSIINHLIIYIFASPFVSQPSLPLLLITAMLPAAGYNSLLSGFIYNRFLRSFTRGWLSSQDY